MLSSPQLAATLILEATWFCNGLSQPGSSKKETNQKIRKDTKVNKTSFGAFIKRGSFSSKAYISLRALQTETLCAVMNAKQQGCCKEPTDWRTPLHLRPSMQEDNKSSFISIHKSLYIRLNLSHETARRNIL